VSRVCWCVEGRPGFAGAPPSVGGFGGPVEAPHEVVTHVSLKSGNEPEWDAAMRHRLEGARSQPGWIGGQLLIPLDGANKRVIIGTWETRAHWEAWHQDAAFAETRERLEGLEDGQSQWYEVLMDLRPAPAARSAPGRAA